MLHAPRGLRRSLRSCCSVPGEREHDVGRGVHPVGAGLPAAGDGRDQRQVPRPDHHRPRRRRRPRHRQQQASHGGARRPLARDAAGWHAVGRRHGVHLPVRHQPRGLLHLRVRRRQAGDVLLPRALRDAEGGGAVRVAHRGRHGGAGRALPEGLRRRAQRAAQRLVPRERVRAGGRAGAQGQALRVDRRASDDTDQRARAVRLHAGEGHEVPQGHRQVRQDLRQGQGGQAVQRRGEVPEAERVWALLPREPVRARRLRRGAWQDVQAQDRQHHHTLCPQPAGPRARADGGGGGRQPGGAVQGHGHRHLLRRELLRPAHDEQYTDLLQAGGLLDLRGRERTAPQDAAGHRRPEIHQQQVRLAGQRAAGDSGLGRHRPQQELHLQDQSPEERHHQDTSAEVGGAEPDDRDAQHADPGRRAREVGDQQRLPGAAGHPVPGSLLLRPPGPRLRRRGRGAGQVPRGLQREPAAGREQGVRGEAERPGVRAAARRAGGRGAPERGHDEGEDERDAPVAPARPRLLGAGLRRRAVRRRQGLREAQHGGPAAPEHGGGVPARVDGAAVRGGQHGGVGVPLPHRAAPPHGHGRRLHRRGRQDARAQRAQGGHDVRGDQDVRRGADTRYAALTGAGAVMSESWISSSSHARSSRYVVICQCRVRNKVSHSNSRNDWLSNVKCLTICALNKEISLLSDELYTCRLILFFEKCQDGRTLR